MLLIVERVISALSKGADINYKEPVVSLTICTPVCELFEFCLVIEVVIFLI